MLLSALFEFSHMRVKGGSYLLSQLAMSSFHLLMIFLRLLTLHYPYPRNETFNDHEHAIT